MKKYKKQRLCVSQSLSSRAMSFDIKSVCYKWDFEMSQSLSSRAMSFDCIDIQINNSIMSQSLSSRAMSFDLVAWCYQFILLTVSIPFEQGDVFRPVNRRLDSDYQNTSQSLSSRAMSFDCSGMLEAGIMRSFRPTSQFFWKVKELALDLSK